MQKRVREAHEQVSEAQQSKATEVEALRQAQQVPLQSAAQLAQLQATLPADSGSKLRPPGLHACVELDVATVSELHGNLYLLPLPVWNHACLTEKQQRGLHCIDPKQP